MFSFIRFGLTDNGVLLICALVGISMEGSITRWLNRLLTLSPWTVECRDKRVFGVFAGMIGNGISDFTGGLVAMNMELAVGSFVGCMMVVLVAIPLTYKIVKK